MKKLISMFAMLAVIALVAGPSFSADNQTNMRTSTDSHAFMAQPERFSDIEKTEVLSSDNHRLGKFNDFVVDKSGKISYLLFHHGMLSGTIIPVPWDFAVKNMNYDPNKKEYVLNVKKDQLDKAPNFKEKDLRLGSDQFKNVNDYYARLSSDHRG